MSIKAHQAQFWRCVVAGAVLATVPACQRYHTQPLNLAGHQAAFIARTLESADVAGFAAGIAQATPAGAAPFTLSDGLTLNEAEVLALYFNAELRMHRLRSGVTKAGAEHAGRWDDPTIGVDVARFLESVEHPWTLGASLGFTIPVSGRLGIEKRHAGSEHDAELARVALDEWRVRNELRRAWARWSALETHLAAMRDFIPRVEQVLAIVDAMEREEEMSRIEARLLRIEHAARRSELAQLESRVELAALDLHSLMGLSPVAPVTLVPSGFAPPAGEGRPWDGIEARSPQLLLAAAEYEVAERSLQLEIRKQYPDLQIAPGLGRDDGMNQALLGLEVPLPLFNANRRAIAQARAQRDVARAAAERALEQVLTDGRRAELTLKATQRRRYALEADVIPLVDIQYKEVQRVAELGEVNVLLLIESLSRQMDAKAQLIESLLDERLAAIALDELHGGTEVQPEVFPPGGGDEP